MTVQQMQEKSKAAQMFAGKWHNQHNSEIELTVGVAGQVTGIFRTGVASSSVAREPEEYPLTGFISKDVIAFCVKFEEHASVTAWVGQLTEISEDNNTQTLHSLWHMAIDVGNQAEKLLWKSTISGADNFVRGPRLDERNTLKTTASYPFWMESRASAY